MGRLVNILAGLAKALRRPVTETDQRYVGATVRTGEEVSGKYDTLNQRDAVRVGRASVGTIAVACNLLSNACARGELKLYRKTKASRASKAMGKDDEAEEVMEHPVLDLLRDPDPSMTSAEWFKLLYWYREAAGIAYIWTGGDTPTGLYLLAPQYTRPVLDHKEGVTHYRYGRENSRPLEVPASQVVVTRWKPDPMYPYLASTWTDAVWHYADMESAAVTSELQRWKSGGQYGMIFSVPKEATDEYVKQFAAAVRQKGGPTNAGSALVLRGETTVVQANSKPHEMNYASGLERAEKAIYDAAGVPESVWRMNDANRASATTGNAEWGRVVYERQCAVASDLTEWLLPMFGVEPGEMWFAYANPVQEDQTAIVGRIRDAFIASAGRPDPVVDASEYRAALGLDPREETPEEEPTTAPVAEGAAPALAGADVAATALNGAQVDALSSLASQVALGQLPLASARAIAVAAFPMVPMETIDAVFSPLANFTPEVPNETPKNQQTPASGDNPDNTGDDDSGGGGDDPESEGGDDDADPEDQGDAAKARGKGAQPQLKAEDGHKPNEGMMEEAKRGLDWREEFGRGGTAIGVARARDISNGRNLSTDTVYRMASYFARHEVDKQGQGWNKGEDGYPSAGRIAWALWGGDAGRTWAEAIVAREDDAEKSVTVGRWEWAGKCGCGKRHARKADPTDESIEARIFRAVRSWAEDALKRGVAAIGPDGSFDISALSSSELEGLLKASISEAFRAGAVSMTAQYSPDSEPLTSEAARDYIAQYNFDLVSGVTQTMADQMRTTIDAGLEQGKTINEIQQELTDKIPEVSLNRAEVIARTETARAYQHGSMKQAEELGFDSKEWLLSGNPCGLCEGADRAVAGKKVPIKEPFFKAGDTIAGTDGKIYVMSRPVMAASDIHPQCGCVGVPMVTEEES